MSRNFGINVTSPATSGGDRQSPGSHYAQRTQRDSILFPSASILSASDPFERGELRQTFIDCGTVLFAFLFVSLLALAIVAVPYVLFFV